MQIVSRANVVSEAIETFCTFLIRIFEKSLNPSLLSEYFSIVMKEFEMDYDGETTNEASNLSMKGVPGSPLKRNQQDLFTKEVEELKRTLPITWSTGEVIAEETSKGLINWDLVNSEGSSFKASVIIEGKYHKMLKGLLRLKGYDRDEGDISCDLEIVRKPLERGEYEKMLDELSSLLEIASAQTEIKTPSEYHRMHRENKLTGNYNKNDTCHHASPKKKTKIPQPENTGACGSTHIFPVLTHSHDDVSHVGKVRCEGLHMRFDESLKEPGFVLCGGECASEKVRNFQEKEEKEGRYEASNGLFATVTVGAKSSKTSKKPVHNVSNSKGKGGGERENGWPMCASCAAIKENLNAL